MINENEKKKLAIIGASYLQAPLIIKAKEMGIETHVFAWKTEDVGETLADYFYPISIIEKEQILEQCRIINIDGICTIASDLAAVTVCYVAEKMRLNGNSIETSIMSTNKHAMRKCFERNNDPSPRSILVEGLHCLDGEELTYPLIVKPLDRSGSRGIVKVSKWEELEEAIEIAKNQGFEKKALVENFVDGKEYSVECISWRGKHEFLAMTEKYTTGAPNFIETGHIQPAGVEKDKLEEVKQVVFHALDSLNIREGASHSEIKIADTGEIYIIEIGGRMGGDFIGSHLVKLSTGVDFVECVIKCALGKEPVINKQPYDGAIAVRFAINNDDCKKIQQFQNEHVDQVVICEVTDDNMEVVTDSSNRKGYCLAKFENRWEAIEKLME